MTAMGVFGRLKSPDGTVSVTLEKSECSRREALTSARKQGFEGVEKSDKVALYRLTAREPSVLAA